MTSQPGSPESGIRQRPLPNEKPSPFQKQLTRRSVLKKIAEGGLALHFGPSVLSPVAKAAKTVGSAAHSISTAAKSAMDTVAITESAIVDITQEPFKYEHDWNRVMRKKFETKNLGPDEKFIRMVKIAPSDTLEKPEDYEKGVAVRSISDYHERGGVDNEVGRIPVETEIPDVLQTRGLSAIFPNSSNASPLWIVFPERLLQGDLRDEKGQIIATDPNRFVAVLKAYTKEVNPQEPQNPPPASR